MIIDKILDRKDGKEYDPKTFYNDIIKYGEISHDIAQALDTGEEEDVKKELAQYIIKNEYNSKIINYIDSVDWIN